MGNNSAGEPGSEEYDLRLFDRLSLKPGSVTHTILSPRDGHQIALHECNFREDLAVFIFPVDGRTFKYTGYEWGMGFGTVPLINLKPLDEMRYPIVVYVGWVHKVSLFDRTGLCDHGVTEEPGSGCVKSAYHGGRHVPAPVRNTEKR